MTGSESMWVPWAMGAAGGLGGYLSGGGTDESAPIIGMPLKGTDWSTPELYKGYLADMGRLGAVGAQRAARDISLPGAFVQRPPFIKGGPVDVGVTGRDPAEARPELLRRPGVDWGRTPPYGQMVSARDVYRSAEQPSPPQPMLGGGLQEAEDALGLLGIERDATGMLTFAANQFSPTSAHSNIRSPLFERLSTGARPLDPLDRKNGNGNNSEPNYDQHTPYDV